MNKTIALFIGGLGAAILGGCGFSAADYKATVLNGVATIPHVSEIRRMFPDAPTDCFLGEYGLVKPNPVTWNTELWFGGKYEFTYQIDVIVDYEKNRIVRTTTAPIFDLVRVAKVYDNSSGTIGTDFSEDHHFTEKDWEKVVAAKGNFSVIGINLDTNSPVPRFNDYINATRRDFVSIRF